MGSPAATLCVRRSKKCAVRPFSINDAAMVRQMFAAELDGPPLQQRAIGWITGASLTVDGGVSATPVF